jgi:uncharacterized membrane protein
MFLEFVILVLALVASLALRPWRLLAGGALVSPLLGSLVILPWLWALPRLHTMPLQLQLSGACAVTLMLGWPLAIPVLTTVALLSGLLAPVAWEVLIGQLIWLGVLPATLALVAGALLRRWVGTHLFVFILGRAFIGTALCTFLASSLSQLAGFELANVDAGLSLVARWLMAWGDAFMTGMLAAIFVAYRPQWLATWSDALYLKK